MTPREKVWKYIETNLQKEKERWESGLKNDYMAWDELSEDLYINFWDNWIKLKEFAKKDKENK